MSLSTPTDPPSVWNIFTFDPFLRYSLMLNLDVSDVQHPLFNRLEGLRSLVISNPGHYSLSLNPYMSNLQCLHLSGADIPPLVSLLSLSRLTLTGFYIKGLPEDLETLPCLRELIVIGTKLSSIPYSLTRLTLLDLSSNNIGEISSLVGKMTKLTHLDLSRNAITSLPIDLESLTKLKTLKLGDNKIDVKFKWSFLSSLLSLEMLCLDNCDICKAPSFLTLLSSIRLLDLSENNIAYVPLEISRLTKLEQLHLNNNKIEMLPWQLKSLSLLTDLDIENNANSRLINYHQCLSYDSYTGDFVRRNNPTIATFLGNLSRAIRWTPYPPERNKWCSLLGEMRIASTLLLCWKRLKKRDSRRKKKIVMSSDGWCRNQENRASMSSLQSHSVIDILSFILMPLPAK